jgi:hypothetical protein
MRFGLLFSFVIFSFVLLSGRPAHADSPVSKMAGMVMHLNHHPDELEKKDLQKMIDDKATPENERVIASALMNMNHEVGDADKTKLKKIVDDKSAPADVKELADILMNIKHKPKDDAKARLKKLMP